MTALVKLDGQVIAVQESDDKKALPARIVGPEEVFEKVVLDGEEYEKQLDNNINRMVQESAEEILQQVKDSTKIAAMKSLGFDSRWGQWEIDHCNGRASIISDLVSANAKKQVIAEFDKFLAENIGNLFEEMKPIIVKEYEETFKRLALEKARRSAEEEAARILSEEVKSQVEALLPQVRKSVRQMLFAPKPPEPPRELTIREKRRIKNRGK